MPCCLGGRERRACRCAIVVDCDDNIDDFENILSNGDGDHVSFVKMLVIMRFGDTRGDEECGAERQNHGLLHVQFQILNDSRVSMCV